MSKDDENNGKAQQSQAKAENEVSPMHQSKVMSSELTNNNISSSLNTVYVPSCGIYINNVVPSHKHTILQFSDNSKILKHFPMLDKISQTTPKLLNHKMQYSLLTATKSVLELCHKLFVMEKKIKCLSKSWEDTTKMLDSIDVKKRNTEVSNSHFQVLSTTTKSSLDTLVNDMKDSLKLLEGIPADVFSPVCYQKLFAQLKTKQGTNVMIYCCTSLTQYVTLLAEHVIKLQSSLLSCTDIDLTFATIVYKCYVLLLNIAAYKLKVSKLPGVNMQYSVTNNRKNLRKRYNFVFLNPGTCLDAVIDFHKLSLNNYIQELAKMQSFSLAEKLSNASLNSVFKSVTTNKHAETFTTNEQVKEFRYNGVLPETESLRYNPKNCTKLLKKYYLKILSDVQHGFSKLLSEIMELNNNILRKNTHLLYKPTPFHGGISSFRKLGNKRLFCWETSIGPVQQEYIYDQYATTLWKTVKEKITSAYVSACVNCEKSYVHGQNNNKLRKAEKDLVRHVTAKLDSANVSHLFLEVLSVLSFNMSTIYNLQQWDEGLSKTMAVYLKDRFRYTDGDSGIASSQTVQHVLKYQFVLLKDQIADLKKEGQCSWKETGNNVVDLQNSLLQPLRTSSAFLNFCLFTKRQQFLSSASWEQFFVVSAVDINKIVYYGELTINAVEELLESEQENEFPEILNCWKMFEENSLKMMAKSIGYRSKNVWQQHMPSKKIWRRRGSSRLAYQASPYINVAIQSVFAPFMGSLGCLSRDQSIDVICRCVQVFIKTWMEHILNEQIPFSRFGATQLDFDFLHFLQWFEQDGFDFSLEELSEIHDLPVISDMKSAILLLSCQPPSKRNIHDEQLLLSLNSASNNLASSTSAISQVSIGSLTGNQYDEIIQDVHLHDKERWLALRVKGGNLSKKGFLCVG